MSFEEAAHEEEEEDVNGHSASEVIKSLDVARTSLILHRAVIEEVIRELEFESPVRWAPVIDKLRSVL